MKTHNAIQRLALTALVAVLGACASGTQAPEQAGAAPAATESVRFPEAGSAWLKGGTFVNVEQLRRVGRGMTKNQVRELISYPHFSEGLFGPKEWDYLFNFRTGRGDEFVTCQYKGSTKMGCPTRCTGRTRLARATSRPGRRGWRRSRPPPW